MWQVNKLIYFTRTRGAHNAHTSTSSTDWVIRFSFINIIFVCHSHTPSKASSSENLRHRLACVRYEWHMHHAYSFFARIIWLFFTISTRIERKERFRLIENYCCFDWTSSALTKEIISTRRLSKLNQINNAFSPWKSRTKFFFRGGAGVRLWRTRWFCTTLNYPI